MVTRDPVCSSHENKKHTVFLLCTEYTYGRWLKFCFSWSFDDLGHLMGVKTQQLIACFNLIRCDIPIDYWDVCGDGEFVLVTKSASRSRP